MRQMVGERKGGAPPLNVAIQSDDEEQNDEGSDAPENVTECPNCDCQFNPENPEEVVKEGKPVMDDSPEDQGGDSLDETDSQWPVPGENMDSARDAALGEQAITEALNSARRR